MAALVFAGGVVALLGRLYRQGGRRVRSSFSSSDCGLMTRIPAVSGVFTRSPGATVFRTDMKRTRRSQLLEGTGTSLPPEDPAWQRGMAGPGPTERHGGPMLNSHPLSTLSGSIFKFRCGVMTGEACVWGSRGGRFSVPAGAIGIGGSHKCAFPPLPLPLSPSEGSVRLVGLQVRGQGVADPPRSSLFGLRLSCFNGGS